MMVLMICDDGVHDDDSVHGVMMMRRTFVMSLKRIMVLNSGLDPGPELVLKES